jgi:hypothetical protein
VAYAEVKTRPGIEGTIDKIALIDAMADRFAQDRDFQELVLSKMLRGAGSSADEQILAIQRFVESRRYVREISEILRNPLRTAIDGGDCDDLVVLSLAALRGIGIPAEAEVVANSDGIGFHVRTLAAFPPLRPEYTVVIDPVYRSEPEWAMAGADLSARAAQFPSASRISQGSGTPRQNLLPVVLVTVALTWLIARRWR